MISCGKARATIAEGLRGGAGEGARLELDRHLAACAACREERARFEIVGVLKSYEPPQLGAAARARIVDRLVAREARPEASVQQRWGRALAAAAAVVALAGGAAAVARWQARPATPPEVARVAPPEAAPAAPPQVAAAPAPTPTPTPTSDQPIAIRADRPGRLELPSVAVAYGADARLSLDPKSRVLDLERGEVDLDVRQAPSPLRVVTAGFVVEVRTSRVQVGPSSVRVVRGDARILDLGGHDLMFLSEGAAWSAGPAAVRSAKPAGPSAASLLERAHTALAAGSTEEARQLAAKAIDAGADARQRAKADSLRALVFTNERRYDEALAAWRRVAVEHPRSPEAEDGRFFVGQILFERGRRAEAEAALSAYLVDFPSGQYAAEARSHLAELRPER